MRWWTQALRTGVAAAVAAGLATSAGRCARAADETAPPRPAMSEETRGLMSRLVESLQVLLLATAHKERFADPVQEARLRAAARELADGASALAVHGSDLDRESGFVGRSLARDAREIERSLAREDLPRAQYLIQNVTENCIACHSRLPSDSSLRADAFISSAEVAALPPATRADLQIATRRFDDALDTLEELLLSPDTHAELLIAPLTDYLVVSIRVKGDLKRPIPVLRRFAKRPDLWRQRRKDGEAWIPALEDLGRRMPPEPDLAWARAVIEEGRGMVDLRTDRAAFIHAIVASSVLQRYIEGNQHPVRDLAEAYYLLGVVEVYTGTHYWLTQADFYLSTSIRLAPEEPFAGEAYALLEEQVLLEYEGSEEEAIPDYERRRLDELRALID